MCSPSAPSQPTQTSQVTIPEYAKPQVERLLGKSEALTESPYQAYGGQRMAASTPEQQAARQNVAGMQLPGQYAAGTGRLLTPVRSKPLCLPICKTWLTFRNKRLYVMLKKVCWLRT